MGFDVQRHMSKHSMLLILLVLLPFVLSTTGTPSTSKHNILHIISDDLRPELGAYGLPLRHTPNLDAIASRGTVFTRAFAQHATTAVGKPLCCNSPHRL